MERSLDVGKLRLLTPEVVRGSERGLLGWNSPWAFVILSAFRAAILISGRRGMSFEWYGLLLVVDCRLG